MGAAGDPDTGQTDGGTDAIDQEVDRLSGDILDGKVPSADAPPPAAGSPTAAAGAPPPPAGALLPSSPDAARAYFVLSTLDDVAAPLPNQAGPPPPDPSGDAVLGAWETGVNDAYEPTTGHKPDHGAPLDVKRYYGRAVAGVLTVGLVVFLAAILALQGNDEPGSGVTAVQPQPTPTPTAAPTPTPTAAPTPSATPEPSADPTPTTSPVADTPAPGATSTPQSITLRGPIDTKAMSKAGLQIGQNEVELVVFLDNGSVTGSMVLVFEEFPIGAILTGTFGGEGDPDYAKFKECTTRLHLEGIVKGTYSAATGKLKGKIRIQPVSEDVHNCLDTRPSNITMDSTTEPSTIAWSATLAGSRAKGRIGTEPVSAFIATAVE